MLTTADDIATLVRRQNWKNGGCLILDHDEAVELIERYAQMVAAAAASVATEQAFKRAIAIIDTRAATDKAVA